MESTNPPELSSTLLLDRFGEVSVTLDPDGFSWKPVDDDSNTSSCLCIKLQSSSEDRCCFSNTYAVEFIGWGSIRVSTGNVGSLFSYSRSQMYRFVVYSSRINKISGSPWVLSEYTFGHKNLQACQAWVEHLNSCINMEVVRPKNLLVFVHPLCGKGNGRQTWDRVAPIFSRAKVQTKVVETQRARHAFDTVAALSDGEFNSLDGIVIVGGDGLFNEILNGLLSSRHNAPYLHVPKELDHTGKCDQNQQSTSCRTSFNDANNMLSVASCNDDNEPLLSSSESYGLGTPKPMTKNGTHDTDQGHEFSFPNDRFRFGLIPAGSTDAIVLSTTGVRDPITSALQIVLGKRMSLDIARVVRWKVSPSSTVSPSVHYAASFAGYGFYGDVIRESEQHRWMGPKRYDYAGTMAFLKHRSYEAEITFLDDENDSLITGTNNNESQANPSHISEEDPDKVICRANCSVCNQAAHSHPHGSVSNSSRWSHSKGCFLSIGAAIISCRNERAPDGLVANAHLADGFLHLILIKDCPRPFYLWHLTKLTRRGANPFNFEFIEHHKTSAFTFVSSHDKGRWNLDGELFQACEVSVQVFRGLINLFASGPAI